MLDFKFLNNIDLNKFKIKNKKVGKTPYNHHGRICIRHIKKGKPVIQRICDITQDILDIPGFVVKKFIDKFNFKEYALIYYINGYISYILDVAKLPIDYLIYKSSYSTNRVTLGTRYALKAYPTGCLVSNIEFSPHNKNKLCTSSGLYAKIIKHTKFNYTILQLAKKQKVNKVLKYKYLYIHSKSKATFGIVKLKRKMGVHFKAGDALRIYRRRPRVRGVAMNPVDHPHGGGEGKSSGGRPSSTPWGIYCKGYKTSNKRDRVSYKRRLRYLFTS